MAILTLQSRGLLVLLLLAGNEVATVNAMRSKLDLDKMVQERPEEDPPVPTSSSECLWAKDKGKCEPAQYCYFGRRWSNLGGLNRDKACKLKWLYEPDEKLAYRFGAASAKVIKKSEEFRTSGSLSQLGKLKGYLYDLGQCANAATSEVPAHKTHLNRLKTAFQDEPISQYATSVNTMAGEIPGIKEFNTDDLENEALSAKALERMAENMDEGFKKNIVTRTVAAKINIKEIMKVLADADADEATIADADEATIAERMKRVVPDLSQAQLDTLVPEAVAKKHALLEECSGFPNELLQDECFKGLAEARMDSMSERLSEAEHKSVNALLQYAESKGLSQAKHDEDHHDRRNRAFSFLEEHMESVDAEGELTEHGKEMSQEYGFDLQEVAMLSFLFVLLVVLAVGCVAAPG